MHEAVEGVRFVRSQPILLGAISLDLFAVLFGGAVALLPAIAENRLGVGAVGLGLLRAAIGVGAGAVTLFLVVRPVQRRVGRTLLFTVALFGVGTIALGATTNFVVAFVALMVLSGADSVSVFIRSTLVPLVTPPEKRGRVLAVEAVFIGASNELGAFESGVVGQLFGRARGGGAGRSRHARGCRAVVGSVPGAAQRRPVPRLGPALSDVNRATRDTRSSRVARCFAWNSTGTYHCKCQSWTSSAESRNAVRAGLDLGFDPRPAAFDVDEAEPEERELVPVGIEPGPFPVDERHPSGSLASHCGR